MKIQKNLQFIILMVILSGFVSAMSISGSPFRPNPRLFEPGFTVEKTYVISQYKYPAEPYLSGSLQEYAEIYNHVDLGNTQSFSVRLTMPEEIEEPGLHTLLVGGKEVPPEDLVGIITITRAEKALEFLVLYDEIYAKFYGFGVPNINENETGKISFVAESLTKQPIHNIVATIKIFDFNRNLVKTLVNKFDLESATTLMDELGEHKKIIFTECDSTGLSPGQYSAEAEIIWKNNTKILKSNFNIGTLQVDINGFYPNNFSAGQINKIEIEIESKWNGATSAYAELYIDDEEQTATQTYTIGPFEKKLITGFLDLNYIDGGKKDLKIILKYGNKDQTILEEKVLIIGDGKEKEKEPREPISVSFNSTTIMIILSILVLILFIVVILQMKKKK